MKIEKFQIKMCIESKKKNLFPNETTQFTNNNNKNKWRFCSFLTDAPAMRHIKDHQWTTKKKWLYRIGIKKWGIIIIIIGGHTTSISVWYQKAPILFLCLCFGLVFVDVVCRILCLIIIQPLKWEGKKDMHTQKL